MSGKPSVLKRTSLLEFRTIENAKGEVVKLNRMSADDIDTSLLGGRGRTEYGTSYRETLPSKILTWMRVTYKQVAQCLICGRLDTPGILTIFINNRKL
jgi:hypothetical protein